MYFEGSCVCVRVIRGNTVVKMSCSKFCCGFGLVSCCILSFVVNTSRGKFVVVFYTVW